MPFSFNPTVQSGGQEGNTQPAESGFSQPVQQGDALVGVPTAPSSPFLFLEQRGEDGRSTMAYIQIVLIVINVITLVSAITLSVYYFYLNKVIDSKKTAVVERETTFKDYPFEEMRKVYVKMITIDALLKEYASGRTPLLLLEKVVENEVLFSEFNLFRETSGKYNMQLTAVTSNYKVLVQQLEALKLASYAKVVPSSLINNIEENKQTPEGQIRVKVLAPLNIQGVLPDTVIFDEIVDANRQPENPAASSTQDVSPGVQATSSSAIR